MVGLILGIVGGVNAGNTLAATSVYEVQTLSQVGLGLFIGSYVIIVFITILTSFSVSHAKPGEKRLLYAVALSLPFLLVRLVYSTISTFSKTPSFNLVSSDVTIILCMALLEELITVIIYEACGLTLQKAEKFAPLLVVDQIGPDGSMQKQPGRVSQVAAELGKRTIIGRLITAAMSRGDEDIEMQQQRHGRKHRRR
jgi:hypothetical protein